jgi:hypothetical protein
MLKQIIFLSLVGVVAFGFSLYQVPKIMVVDVSKIIKTAAQHMAQADMSHEDASSKDTVSSDMNSLKHQSRLLAFKKQLETSLNDYAHQKRAIVLNKAFVFGDVPDQTEDFIRFHNKDEGTPS